MLNKELFYANAKNRLCRKRRTFLINSENGFYECGKLIRIYNIHDVRRANFINVETNFIAAKNRF